MLSLGPQEWEAGEWHLIYQSLFVPKASFYETISGNFERFQYFNFETNILESEKRFQIEITQIENVSFPCKTALSEANVNTNRMSTKRTYHKERSFANNYFIFSKKFFQLKNLLTKSCFDVLTT